ncbi:MAG: hypothetical protein PVJ61_00890 [Dehalococcoidia bacterium]|jgi:hypothetical protein
MKRKVLIFIVLLLTAALIMVGCNGEPQARLKIDITFPGGTGGTIDGHLWFQVCTTGSITVGDNSASVHADEIDKDEESVTVTVTCPDGSTQTVTIAEGKSETVNCEGGTKVKIENLEIKS